MSKPVATELEFQLRRLFATYGGTFANYQWPFEDMRWVELVTVIVSRITNKYAKDIRPIILALKSSELLDMDQLSTLPRKSTEIDVKNSSYAERILSILEESEFSEEQAKESLLAMHEVAYGLKNSFGGKVQQYLRSYGHKMLNELKINFKFSKMTDDDVNYGFSHWLQNVLNMPISLNDKSLQKFCLKFDSTITDLERAADKLDMNLALLDDLIADYWLSEKDRVGKSRNDKAV